MATNKSKNLCGVFAPPKIKDILWKTYKNYSMAQNKLDD